MRWSLFAETIPFTLGRLFHKNDSMACKKKAEYRFGSDLNLAICTLCNPLTTLENDCNRLVVHVMKLQCDSLPVKIMNLLSDNFEGKLFHSGVFHKL